MTTVKITLTPDLARFLANALQDAIVADCPASCLPEAWAVQKAILKAAEG